MIFDRSFLFARLGGGEKEVKLTRAERSLLLLFTANVRKVLTRDQLLDAVSRPGSDVSDRNIDFLINRLRAKLGDSARAPSLIATQYGEGYVWIAEPSKEPGPAGVLLVIGPVFGVDRQRTAPHACAFLTRMQALLESQTADDQIVVLDENWSLERGAASDARFSLDVSFYDDRRELHCAMVLRDAATRQMLRTFRLRLDRGGVPVGEPSAESLAISLKEAMWRHATLGQGSLAGPADVPLGLRMHQAARLFDPSSESWMQMGEQLARERSDKPNNPETNLMWAMHLRARLLQTLAEIDNRAAIENEIETLVFDRLAAFEDNPVFLLGAAKLLLFVGRGHLALAEQLAERAFTSSAAFAASFSVLAQIRMCKGEIAGALAHYDRALELAGEDIEFRVFLLVLKCVALLALDDRATLDKTCNALYALKPVTRLSVGLPTAPPGPLAADLELLLAKFDAARARQSILYLYYNFARLFVREEHRQNIMCGLVSRLTGRFGPEIVAKEVWRAVPGLTRMRGSQESGSR